MLLKKKGPITRGNKMNSDYFSKLNPNSPKDLAKLSKKNLSLLIFYLSDN